MDAGASYWVGRSIGVLATVALLVFAVYVSREIRERQRGSLLAGLALGAGALAAGLALLSAAAQLPRYRVRGKASIQRSRERCSILGHRFVMMGLPLAVFMAAIVAAGLQFSLIPRWLSISGASGVKWWEEGESNVWGWGRGGGFLVFRGSSEYTDLGKGLSAAAELVRATRASPASATKGLSATETPFKHLRGMELVMGIKKGLGLLAASAAYFVMAGSAFAAPGDLDTSFAGDGTQVTNITDDGFLNSTDTAQDVALQPDGKIVVAGRWYIDDGGGVPQSWAVQRWNASGYPDLGFGGGSVFFGNDNNPPHANDGGLGLAIQSNGKLLLGGSAGSNGEGLTAARLSGSTGQYDTTFGSPNGYRTLDFDPEVGGLANEFGRDLALQPNDGRILLAGRTASQFALGRLNADTLGTTDNGFDNNGMKLVNFSGASDGANALALSGTKIVAAGQTDGGLAIYQALSNGAPDPTFRPDLSAGPNAGETEGGAGQLPLGAEDVAVQPDGGLIVVGPGGGSFGVARVTAAGSYDPGFGVGPIGQVPIDFGGADTANAVALQPDGKIVVAGTDGDAFAVARLMPNGSLDSSFGSGGRTTANCGGSDTANAIALQPDGKIVLAGTTGSDFCVMRLEGDPPPPPPAPAAAAAAAAAAAVTPTTAAAKKCKKSQKLKRGKCVKRKKKK